MMHKGVFILLVISGILFAESVKSQNKIDSLVNLIKTSNADTNMVNSLLMLSREYYHFNPSKSLYIGQKALLLSKHLNYDKGIAASYFNISLSYQYLGKYSDELTYILKAFPLFQKLGSKKAIANCCNNLGINYFIQGNYPEAVKYFQYSLKIHEQLGNKTHIAYILLNIGNIYCFLNDFHFALKYFANSLDICNEINDQKGKAKVSSNIGMALNQMGKHKEALKYIKASNLILKKIGNKYEIAKNYSLTGESYSFNEEYDKAYKYAIKANKMYLEIGIGFNNYDLATNYLVLAKITFMRKNYKKAIQYCKKALKISQNIDAQMLTQKAYLILSTAHDSLNNYTAAFKYFKLSSKIADSIYGLDVKKKLMAMQTKYEIEKKEKQLKIQELTLEKQKLLLTQKNNFIYGIVFITLLLVFAIILFFRQYWLKTTKTKIELQQKLLRTQMNPHFMFNSMLSIQSFIYENNSKDAAIYLKKFADLMRLILENSREEFIALSSEIKTLENYLELQKVRFDNKFDYSINVDDSLQKDFVFLPPMLAQPFIENAIEHGLVEKIPDSRIKINFKLSNKFILFEIEDNGIGYLNPKIIQTSFKKKHRSQAIMTTKERLYCLNKGSFRKKFRIRIVDMSTVSNGSITGTKVIFTIPYIG